MGQRQRLAADRQHIQIVGLAIAIEVERHALFAARDHHAAHIAGRQCRSEEHTSELQSLMRISYAVFGLKKKTKLLQSTFPTHTNDLTTSASLIAPTHSYITSHK